MKKGKVYLVGAGPGDPELLTLKGLKALEKADCIIYDYLSNSVLLNNYEVEKIYVGKQGKSHTKTQEEINKLLVEKTKKGKTVVRLKGGDPFIFGRGGEEAEVLEATGLPFQIIPGISSFYAAPAYAGISLTHRDYADALEVITGHRRSDRKKGPLNLPDYNAKKTFVFLMGMENLSSISQKLIKEKNFPASLPVAIISWGTKPEQKVAEGRLDNIVAKVKEKGVKAPAIIVVGRVAKLRKKLNWFEALPLFGKRIVVTRTRSQASKLSEKISALGAEVIEFPTIEIKSLKPSENFIKKLKNISQYEWLIFTSPNAVDLFFQFFIEGPRDLRDLKGVKIAVIGPATAEKLEKRGLRPDLMPVEFVAESLLKEFRKKKLLKKKILLPCSQDARLTLKEGLEKLGAKVDRFHLYKTIKPKNLSAEKIEKVKKADLITFTSSSTVLNFYKIIKKSQATLACIGPITAQTLREKKENPQIIAKEYTIDGLVQAILAFYLGEKNENN